jgi:acetoacetate decarboxylase
MEYPQAPWTLKGYAFLSLHLIDIAKASPFVPVELAIVSSLPGKTLGGVYLSQYTNGSNLTYSELIVVAGIVSWRGTIGAWVSHIYVNNPKSVAGGREIWGLPKEMANFHWESGDAGRVTVRQGDQMLCSWRSTGRFSLLRQRFSFPSFSEQNGNFLRFNSTAQANFGLVSATLDIPQSAPFGRLIDSSPLMSVRADSLDLKVDGPQSVGKRAV